ncbi:hypothetical protein A2U01_0108089, partial [Trifolium medium]|nr:hypothetical protein [Trifolium medium]
MYSSSFSILADQVVTSVCRVLFSTAFFANHILE